MMRVASSVSKVVVVALIPQSAPACSFDFLFKFLSEPFRIGYDFGPGKITR
jgi:hypothetical protein